MLQTTSARLNELNKEYFSLHEPGSMSGASMWWHGSDILQNNFQGRFWPPDLALSPLSSSLKLLLSISEFRIKKRGQFLHTGNISRLFSKRVRGVGLELARKLALSDWSTCRE